MAAPSVEIAIQLKDEISRDLRRVSDEIDAVGDAADRSGKRSAGLMDALNGIGGIAAGAAAAGLVAVGAAMAGIVEAAFNTSEMLAKVNLQLGDMADGQDTAAIAQQAQLISDKYGVEMTEAVAGAQALVTEFGISFDEAFQFVTAGFDAGLDRGGDFLDSINEYSVQFANSGASAEQFFSVMQTGLESGVLGTDKAADLFKEFSIRLVDGSATTADALAILESLGSVSSDLLDNIASGAMLPIEAFEEISAAVNGIEDYVLRAQVGVALFGTQFEDLGQDISNISASAVSFDEIAERSQAAQARVNSLGEFFARLQSEAGLALVPLANGMLVLANQAFPVLLAAIQQFIPNLTAGFTEASAGVDAFIAPFRVVADAVMPAFMQAWQAASGALAAALPQFSGTSNALAAWQPVLAAVGAAIQTYLIFVFTTLANVLTVVLPPVITAAATLFAGLAAAFVATGTFIDSTIKAIRALLEGDLTGAFQFASAAGQSLSDALIAVFGGIYDATATIVQALVELMIELFLQLASEALRIVEAWAGDLARAFALMATGIGASIVRMAEQVVAAFTAMLATVRNVATSLQQAISQAFQKTASDAAALATRMQNDVIAAFNRLLSSVRSVMESIRTATVAGFNAIVAAASDVASNMFAAGGAIVDNLLQGFLRGWDRAWAAIQDKLRQLRDAMPGSEPKDRTSPLYGLSDAGRAIVGNLQAGILDAPRLELPQSMRTDVVAGASEAAPATTMRVEISVSGAILRDSDMRRIADATSRAIGDEYRRRSR